VVSRRVALVLAAAVSTAVVPARAQPPIYYPRGWPQPAAGPSASGAPELLLTFDDGPDPATTPIVLDILRARGLRAVFFQVGWRFHRGDIPRSRALDARLVREGHIVGNHTINHAQLCSAPFEQGEIEIAGARDLLEEATAMPVPWFRTPYGARCPRVERLLAEQGLTHFHWDIDPQEWRGLGAKATAYKVIASLMRLQGRGVLLMHDTKLPTRYALTEILDWIDAENRRRQKKGRAGIRIIGGDQLAAEQIAPTLAWLRDAIDHGRAGVDAALVATVP
jgi:peptidoglycan/xylan/chitin deacetylase (PgdA/CDA1 family)